jgi:hypothetical protein
VIQVCEELLTTFFLFSFKLREHLLEMLLRTDNVSAGQTSGRKCGYCHCGGAHPLRIFVSDGFFVSVADAAISALFFIPFSRRAKQLADEPVPSRCLPRVSN